MPSRGVKLGSACAVCCAPVHVVTSDQQRRRAHGLRRRTPGACMRKLAPLFAVLLEECAGVVVACAGRTASLRGMQAWRTRAAHVSVWLAAMLACAHARRSHAHARISGRAPKLACPRPRSLSCVGGCGLCEGRLERTHTSGVARCLAHPFRMTRACAPPAHASQARARQHRVVAPCKLPTHTHTHTVGCMQRPHLRAQPCMHASTAPQLVVLCIRTTRQHTIPAHAGARSCTQPVHTQPHTHTHTPQGRAPAGLHQV
jgi:hypothetical protein